MNISKRFAGTSAAALLIAAAFVTVSAPSSFAADRGIAVVAKKKVAKFTFEEKVSAENDVVVEPKQKKKKNFKFLVKEDKPESREQVPVFEQADKNEDKKIEFVVQEDKPAKKLKKIPKSNLLVLGDDKPEGSKKKPRIAQEDKIAEDKIAEDKFDNSLEIADLGGATRDDFETEEAPVKKVKITGKKKPVIEEPTADETEEKATTEESEAVEDPEAEEEPVVVKKVVKKKKVAKKTKKVIEDDYEDSYGDYEDSYGQYDDSYSYNQSYGVSYGGGYSSCH